MDLKFKLNWVLTEISEKTCPLEIGFILNNIFEPQKNQILLYMTHHFKNKIDYIFSSLERVSNFMIISFIFLKHTNTKEIKYEDLQMISNFYENIINMSYRNTFILRKKIQNNMINEDTLRRAFNISRAQIIENFIILQVQKDIKIPNFEKKLTELLELLEQNHKVTKKESKTDFEKENKMEDDPSPENKENPLLESSNTSANLETPLDHFLSIFKNLKKKFHNENAYYANYLDFNSQIFKN
jgi:hypothetical protein